jgi:hypothetical protein
VVEVVSDEQAHRKDVSFFLFTPTASSAIGHISIVATPTGATPNNKL